MDDVLATLPSAQLVRMDTSTTTCTLPAVNFADRWSGLCLARDFWAMDHGFGHVWKQVYPSMSRIFNAVSSELILNHTISKSTHCGKVNTVTLDVGATKCTLYDPLSQHKQGAMPETY